MECPECGNENPERTTSCIHCGMSLEPDATRRPARSWSSRPLTLVGVLAIVVAAGVVVWLLGSQLWPDPGPTPSPEPEPPASSPTHPAEPTTIYTPVPEEPSGPTTEYTFTLPSPLDHVPFPTLIADQPLDYPSDWPADLRYPEEFYLVEFASGTLADGPDGWAAKLRFAGDPGSAASLLASLLEDTGWKVVERTELSSEHMVLLMEWVEKNYSAVSVISLDANESSHSKVLITVLSSDIIESPGVAAQPTTVGSSSACGTGLSRPLVYSCRERDAGVLALCAVCPDDSEPVRLTGPEVHFAAFPVMSPDGQWIAFIGADVEQAIGIYVMRSDGSQLGPILLEERPWELNVILGLSWSPDGEWIVFSQEGTGSSRERPEMIFTVRRDGSVLNQLTYEGVNQDPSCSPNGEWITFVRRQGGTSNIFVMRRDGTEPRQITHGNRDFDPAWSPDGEWIAFRRLDMLHGPIHVVRPDGSETIQVTSDRDVEMYYDWSPDSQWIAFSTRPEDGVRNIYVAARDGSEQRQITFAEEADGVSNGYPVWSPDGQWIAFLSWDSDGSGEISERISVVRPDGTDRRQLTFPEDQFTCEGGYDW